MLFRNDRTGELRSSAKLGITSLFLLGFCTFVFVATAFVWPAHFHYIPRVYRVCGGAVTAASILPFIGYVVVIVSFLLIDIALERKMDKEEAYRNLHDETTDNAKIETPQKKSMVPALRKIFRVVVVIVLVALSVFILSLATSLSALKYTTVPRRDGKLMVKGLFASVSIRNDENNIIHIQGSNDHDVFFAQGWVTARERMWQYEFQTRVGKGTLAEILGEPGVPIDEFSRTIGFHRAGQSAWNAISNQTRQDAIAYCNGINAYLHAKLPVSIEFKLLGIKPSRCEPSDFATHGKLLYWDQTSNVHREVDRLRMMMHGTSLERALDILSPSPSQYEDPNAVTIIESLEELGIYNMTRQQILEFEKQRLDNSFAYIPHYKKESRLSNELMDAIFMQERTGQSNNWVVSGNHTVSGKPLLANDPHMGTNIPSLWYLVHLKSPNFNAFGSTLVGSPGVVLGRNEYISFAMTNAIADQQDLYVLKPDGDDHYILNGERIPYNTRAETIHVAGGKPIHVIVRTSKWGPVVNSVINGLSNIPPTSLRWGGTLDNDTSSQAYSCHWRATNFEQYRECLKYAFGPTVSNLYADTDGNIAYHTSGKIPIRRQGHSGLVPIQGDNDNCEYDGYADPEGLFVVKNPERGFLATSNNRPAPAGVYSTGLDFGVYFRAQRIHELIHKNIQADRKMDVDDMREIQGDVMSGYFHAIKFILNDMKTHDTKLQQYINSMREWNGNMIETSKSATLFEFWIDELAKLTPKETGVEQLRTTMHIFFIIKVLKRETDPACTARGEKTCLEAATRALERAYNHLVTAHGDVPQWGNVHHYRFKHQVLEATPLKCVASASITGPGGSSTVNVADSSLVDHVTGTVITGVAPNYRFITDMATNKSWVMLSTGQDGNMLTNEYDEYIQSWKDVKYFEVDLQQETTNWRYQQELVPK